MGRGAKDKKKAQAMAGEQYDVNKAWLEEQRRQREEAKGRLIPEYEALMKDPGYSPEEQSAMLQESLGATGSVFDVARQGAARRQARTRNTAGYGEMVTELAREEARGKADTTNRLKTQFADERQRRRLQGLQGLSSLYGIDTNLLQSTAGIPINAIGEYNKTYNPNKKPWWQQAIEGGVGIAAGLMTGGK